MLPFATVSRLHHLEGVMMDRFDVRVIDTEEKRFSLDAIVNGDRRCDIPYLDMLRESSRTQIQAVANEIFQRFGLMSDVSEKKAETALDKCTRPTVLDRYPWYRLCHIRDYLRFRTHLRTMEDFETILGYFAEIQKDGLISIVKIDHDKIARPGLFGWRMVSTDMRVQDTGLIVEHYMTFGDMICINEDWLHKVYEKWRSRDTDLLTMPELVRMDRDVQFSRTSYRQLLNAGIVASGGLAIPMAEAHDEINDQLIKLLVSRFSPAP